MIKTLLQKKEKLISACYFGLYIVLGLSLLIVQPFGEPPDEYWRFSIPKYIAETKTLPNGYAEEIRIYGYGFSYGFQPILPYIVQGEAIRFARLFTQDELTWVYIARGVNFLGGLLMAYVITRLSREWFSDKRFGWLFSFLVTFLPQALFMHTYVNTDSCCLLSTVLILYGLTLGIKDGFRVKSSLIMSTGIILCALSYYNAYSFILSCILLFIAYFITPEKKLSFDFRGCLLKGGMIALIVLAGISWWFVRNAILYDGDLLGLRARDHCASLYAIPAYQPASRITWQSQGFSVWDMLKNSIFVPSMVMSFIAVLGTMNITTAIWVYQFYKALFLLGILASVTGLVVSGRFRRKCFHFEQNKSSTGFLVFWHLNMIFCVAMPFILTIIYSYTKDFQPQGRYALPALVPLCAYCVYGAEELWSLFLLMLSKAGKNKKGSSKCALNKDTSEILTTLCTIILCALIAFGTALTIYDYVYPFYNA